MIHVCVCMCVVCCDVDGSLLCGMCAVCNDAACINCKKYITASNSVGRVNKCNE